MDFISINHCYKSFGGVHALVDVNFSIANGEVRGLVGENGSGKSTLMKILAGSLKKDSGDLVIAGESIKDYGPLSGLRYGISVIYQDISLFPNLSVLENICLCQQVKSKSKLFFTKPYAEKAQSILEGLDANVELTDMVEELPIAKQQMIAIARALFNDSKLLIFDEPTTALTREEINKLFVIINKLKAEGLAIIFISHKLDEIKEICDTITILRDGHHIETDSIEKYSIPDIEKLMVGESTVYIKSSDDTIGKEVPVVLEVKHLTKKNNFKDVSFFLRKGEILGITGLLGSGRTELASALFGIAPADSGVIIVNGEEIKIDNVGTAVSKGIALVPEDRLTQGLIMDYPQCDNMVIPALPKYSKKGLLNREKLIDVSQRWIDALKVKTDDHFKEVKTLSGGNQQKIVIGKWLEIQPSILILDGPTVGVDIGAKAGIFKIIREMIDSWCMSVILISDEINEIAYYSHRVLVMDHGRIVNVLDEPREVSESYIQSLLEGQNK